MRLESGSGYVEHGNEVATQENPAETCLSDECQKMLVQLWGSELDHPAQDTLALWTVPAGTTYQQNIDIDAFINAKQNKILCLLQLTIIN